MASNHTSKKPVSKSKSSDKIGLGIASLLNAAKELKSKLSHPKKN